MTHRELREAYINFFKDRAHTKVAYAPLVLQDDATTLFTSSGMQPLVPFLSGKEKHPHGTRLVNMQPCIRTQDIDEVGDHSHTTFFEMMGNWSLGDYFKEEQLAWKWIFLTDVLKLPAEKLYVTVFEGAGNVARDDESAEIWKKLGVSADHIYFYGVNDNWWSRSGPPKDMPTGEIGGPSSEIFYDFGEGSHNGPDSDEERFIEIGNSVFIQYRKDSKGVLKQLPQKNVDFGGGLERILAAVNNQDIFMTDLFSGIIAKIEAITGKTYEDEAVSMRIITDHMRAAVFLIHDNVVPSNKEHGYILRRLLRRAAVKMYGLQSGVSGLMDISKIIESVIEPYTDIYFHGDEVQHIQPIVDEEMKRFNATLDRGLREIGKREHIDGKGAFDLFQSYGFPFELTEELAAEKGIKIDRTEFESAEKKHSELSRSSSAGKFKGGLADTSDQVIKYHTATHLLHQALKDVFGEIIQQEGSNITQDRLRFDSRLDHKPTEDEVKKIQKIMNKKIGEALPVYKKTMSRSDADNIGAASFFREKYGDTVDVYFIGGSVKNPDAAYSKEFCGGPHVADTSEIGKVSLFKVKKIGADLVRFYVK